MKVAIYESLADPAKEIRKEVFMVEQGFQDEYDEMDAVSVHFVLYEEEQKPIATCRVFWDQERKAYTLGRLAVISECRGKNIGSILIKEVEKYVKLRGGTEIILHAQCRAVDFYRKSGFAEFGSVEDEEGCPHIWMRKTLSTIVSCDKISNGILG